MNVSSFGVTSKFYFGSVSLETRCNAYAHIPCVQNLMIHNSSALTSSSISTIRLCVTYKMLSCYVCVFAVRWRRWMPEVCSLLPSLWPALTQRCSSMMCAASRYHGNTAAPGVSLTANCSRANWPGPPATGQPC